jgi:hypothetical protein
MLRRLRASHSRAQPQTFGKIMKPILGLFALLLSAVASSANAKPEVWRAPLLTLGQIRERLVIGQTRQEIIDSIPFQVEALRMPRSGPLKEYTVLFVPKRDMETGITQGIFCRFKDDTEILLKAEIRKEPNLSLQTMTTAATPDLKR